MSNPNKTMRTWLRWTHVLVGVLLATFVYSPLRENAAFVLAVQAALIPVLILTGAWMWQQARVRRLLVSRRRSNPRAGS